MSHFAVTVCLPGELRRDELGPYLRQVLARYDHEREVDPYVEYTKEELIALGRRSIDLGRHPERLQWTDQQVYDHWIGQYEPWEIGPDGETYTTRNQQGQWDYWTVLGTFDRLSEISPDSQTATYAFIDLNGDWHQRRPVHFQQEDPLGAEEWDRSYADLLTALPPETWLVQIDCHS